MEENAIQIRDARRSFSVIGFAFTILILVATVAQLAFVLVPQWLGWKELTEQPWWIWVCVSAPMYLFAFPACCLILHMLPADRPEQNKLIGKQFLTLIPICFCLMYSGNLIGTLLSGLLSGGNAVNSLDSYAMDSNPLKILVMVILAPVLEELICRKLLIDRTVRYGEKISVLMSGLIFGLLHQNLFQFFYAFALGLVFSYIYLRTGRLRYTVLLHGIINFMGSVIAPWILSIADLEALNTLDLDAPAEILLPALGQILPGLLVYLLYATLLWGLSVAGLVLLILKRKQIVWQESPEQLPKGTAVKTVYFNVGMVVYVLLCLASIVLTLV